MLLCRRAWFPPKVLGHEVHQEGFVWIFAWSLRGTKSPTIGGRAGLIRFAFNGSATDPLSIGDYLLDAVDNHGIDSGVCCFRSRLRFLEDSICDHYGLLFNCAPGIADSVLGLWCFRLVWPCKCWDGLRIYSFQKIRARKASGSGLSVGRLSASSFPHLPGLAMERWV